MKGSAVLHVALLALARRFIKTFHIGDFLAVWLASFFGRVTELPERGGRDSSEGENVRVLDSAVAVLQGFIAAHIPILGTDNIVAYGCFPCALYGVVRCGTRAFAVIVAHSACFTQR